MALMLATAAGGVDAIGYLTLFQLFTAHMTGNTAAMAVAIGQHVWSEALRRFFPIPVFVAGVLAGRLVKKLADRLDTRERQLWPLSLEALVLVAYWAIGSRLPLGFMQRPASTYYVVASLPAFAMGVQTTTLRRIADHSIRTTFITGMLAVFGEQLVDWWFLRRTRLSNEAGPSDRERSARARVRITAAIWSAYVVGALLCTVFERRGHFTAIAFPLAAIIAAILLDRRASRAKRDGEPPASSRGSISDGTSSPSNGGTTLRSKAHSSSDRVVL
jgi:uncharacterized membrane protein YoaK (UPF0700 family)